MNENEPHDQQQQPSPNIQTMNFPQPAPMPPSMGLAGIIATIANTSEVVIVTALLVWFLTVSAPMEHERAALQRQLDRDKHAEEVREIAKHEDERLKVLWQRQAEIKTAIVELTIEVRALRKSN